MRSDFSLSSTTVSSEVLARSAKDTLPLEVDAQKV